MIKYNVKIIYKDNFEIDYNDVFVIKTLSDYNKIINLISDYFNISITEIKQIDTLVGHGYTILTSHGLFLENIAGKRINTITPSKKTRENVSNHLIYLKAKMITDQIKALNDGKMLIIQNNFSYFTIPKTLKDDEKYIKNYIIEKKDKIYTKEDINIKNWFGINSKHFYAYVDKFHVYDDKGNYKFNNAKDAEKAAEKYLKKLNNN